MPSCRGGIYTLPSHLSPGARDLIPRMLLVDPLKRITIPEIRWGPVGWGGGVLGSPLGTSVQPQRLCCAVLCCAVAASP